MRHVVRDIQSAAKSLLRAPAFSALVVVTLMVGIGPTVAIFSIVDAMLLRPLPYNSESTLVAVWRHRMVGDQAPVSGPDFESFRTMNRTLQDVAFASWSGSVNLGGLAQPLRVEGALVSPNFFAMLGAPPAYGHAGFQPGRKIVVLSDRLWRESFGADRGVVGDTVRVNGEEHSIAAVMPREFALPEKAELWIPVEIERVRSEHRALHQYRVYGRLRPGVSVSDAENDLKRIGEWIGATYPETSRGIGVSVVPLRESLSGSTKRPLLILFGAVSFLLLIACSNVANLLMTRAAGRQTEVAVRVAMGASPARVARQLLSEGLLLALGGGVAGVFLAIAIVTATRRLASVWITRPELIVVDGRVIAFALGLSLVAALLFALAPLASTRSTADALKSGTRSGSIRGWEGRFARDAIVVVMVASSFFLLSGAALMIRSFLTLRSTETGIRETQNVVAFRIFLPDRDHPDHWRRVALYEELVTRLRRASGVEHAAVIGGLPLENTMSGDIIFPGETDPVAGRRIASFAEAGPGYFRTMGVPVLAGRDFSSDDIRNLPALYERLEQGDATAVSPIVINRTLAERFYPGRSPLGERIMVGGEQTYVVIGVVGDVQQRHAGESVPPHVYLPLGTPLPLRFMTFVVRTALDPAVVEQLVRREMRELAPDVPPHRFRTMAQVMAESTAGPRFQALLLTCLAAAGLFLAVTGIYGVISRNVAQRTREMGLRLATGATPQSLVRMVIGRVARLALAGILFGGLGALLLSRTLEGVLFDVSTFDPRAWVATTVILFATAVGGGVIPARRAGMVDPAVSLRCE